MIKLHGMKDYFPLGLPIGVIGIYQNKKLYIMLQILLYTLMEKYIKSYEQLIHR